MTACTRPAADDRRPCKRVLVGCVVLLVAAVVSGCTDGDARRQAVATSAATIYEAASAIEAGLPGDAAARALRAIKANATAIATSQGYQYPPAPKAAL